MLNEAPAPLSPEPGAFPARWTVSPAASVSPAAGSRPSCVTRDPGFLRARRGPCSPAAPAGGRLSRHMVPARLQPRRRLRDGRPLPPCSPRLQTLLSSQSPLQCGGPPSPQRPSSHCCVPPGTLNTFLRPPLKTGHPFIKYSSLPQSTSLLKRNCRQDWGSLSAESRSLQSHFWIGVIPLSLSMWRFIK